MNKKLIILIILLLCMTFTSCKHDKISEDYPSLEDKNPIVKYTYVDDVIEKINGDYTGIIMFGFKNCPWCQAAISYVDEIAKEKKYKEVLYLDIKDMRDNNESVNHEKYLNIYEKIKEEIDNPEKIFAPTVIVLKDGTITGYHVATVTSHVIVDGNLPPMTDEQINELKEIYRNIF
ncbi:MAG: hypothetical protein SOZ32_06535 [Bacilli bacterium]|nr:hypothetical protein [Mollicutes bacterium]MDY3899838.1 hypothetical protein [Bacilli bacterium]